MSKKEWEPKAPTLCIFLPLFKGGLPDRARGLLQFTLYLKQNTLHIYIHITICKT